MNSLWSFSVTIYRAEEVKQLCLQLQEEAEIDICLFLSLVWLGANGTSLDRPTIISLYHSIARWQSLVTARLRGYRLACYDAKDSSSKSILSKLKRRFYPILKTLELNAEKATFWRINHFLQPTPQANGQLALERQAFAIEHNLANYFSLDIINRAQRHKSEQIGRILLNYLPS
ncbi:MAG: TIGR02444 family protein [Cellvibrionales bacterium]|nr:TIGR02444 family protein [Cellvibrionales bacterium]|tara:strand:- start:9357 stop:9878 length:522 start_codon:yes stop_codon:yes gene_type:complete